MASQTQNIQKLLQAEKRAQDVINAAKTKKSARMKQAKEEAKEEVMQFKRQRDMEFKNLEQQILGDRSNEENEGQNKTVRDIQVMQERVNQNAGYVINFLSQLVCDVKPVLHQNAKMGA